MRAVVQLTLVVIGAIGSNALAEAALGIRDWQHVLQIAAFPLATIPMRRRTRGLCLFVWLFMSGSALMAWVLAGVVPPSAMTITFALTLWALSWLVKRYEAPGHEPPTPVVKAADETRHLP